MNDEPRRPVEPQPAKGSQVVPPEGPHEYVETQSLEGPHAPQEQAHGFDAAAEGDKVTGDIERIVSEVLRYGVLLSFAIVLAGSVWLFLAGNTGYAGLGTIGKGALKTLTFYRGGKHPVFAAPTTPGETIRGVMQGKPYALIALGLLVLIATPVFRVAVSVATFLWEGDRLYGLITAYVLLVLIISFVAGKGG
ncbi:MAG: DUF1634 domain-containing protein [Dehalococcoidia bacterium]